MTQDEKTAETRRRLLDAAILCLVDRGYANTTTSEIAERAGLSRGAQLYHFPRKEELLTSAVEHLFQLMLGEIKDKVGRIASGADRRSAVIDIMWETSNGALITAWIELVVASRTDSYLRNAVRAANDRMTDYLRKTLDELSDNSRPHGPYRDLVPVLIALVVEAMALEHSTLDPALVARMLSMLKTLEW